MRDIEDLSSEERELHEQIASLEESLKKFQDEERSFVNQAANLRKQLVGYRKLYFNFTCYISVLEFFFPKGSCIVYKSFNFNLICV